MNTLNSHNSRPAFAALQQHKKAVSELEGQLGQVMARISTFQNRATEIRSNLSAIAAKAAGRTAVLEAIALGEAKESALDAFDKEAGHSQASAMAANRELEIIAAGAARLERDAAALRQRLNTMAGNDTAAMQYRAALEIATERLQDYQQAAAYFTEATAALVGALVTVDDFADPHAEPRRVYVGSNQWPRAVSLMTPDIPGVKLPALDFDLNCKVGIIHDEIAASLK